MYIIFKYEAKFIFPETKENIASANTIIAETPAAKPSIQSVKLAPFDTAVIIKITIGIKTSQVNLESIPAQLISE